MDAQQMADTVFAAVKTYCDREIEHRVAKALAEYKPEVKEGPRGPAGDPGADGKDGEPGKPGDRGLPGENGQDGRNGIDGEKGLDGTPGDRGDDGIDGARGIDGKDGRNGIDGEKGIDGRDGKDGLDLKDLDITLAADGRTFVFKMADESQTKEWRIKAPIVLDAGLYDEAKSFERGDGTTWGGSWWIAQKDAPTGKPGESADWRLAVKRGREGKEARPLEILETVKTEVAKAVAALPKHEAIPFQRLMPDGARY